MPRWLGWGALGLLVFGLLAAAGVWLWLRGSLPRIDGEVSLSGFTGRVEVVRDRHGVPHILAQNEGDALFALGFVHAQDRLWQMEMNRRIGAGRLAEVLGPAALDTDRLLRTLGLYRRAEATLAYLTPESRQRIAAYTRGVNAWFEARDGPLPPEFLVLGFEPSRWRSTDSLVWPKVMSLDLAREWTRDLMRMRMSEFLPADRILDFYPPYRVDKPWGAVPSELSGTGRRDAPRDPDTGGEAAPAMEATEGGTAHADANCNPVAWTAPASDANAPADRLPQLPASPPSPLSPPNGLSGSNSWVVDGSRSTTGRPILANDPHLGLSAPSTWYFVHLSWPGHDVVGATFPGLPIVVIGHNRRVAWGLTNTGPDVQDLFIEKIDPEDPGRYLTPTGSRAFEVRREVIRVKGGEDVVLQVRESRHGPILDEAWAPARGALDSGHVLALAWTTLREDDLTAQAGLALPQAKDWERFVAAFRDFHSPQQNVAYADVDGNIGLLAPARLPIRTDGTPRTGMVPRPGWDARYDWQGFVPFEELPRVFNPPAGAIVSANHPVAGADYAHHITCEWSAGYRAERIIERLGARSHHDIDSFRSLQHDSVSNFARALLPRLRRVALDPEVGELAIGARELLDGWDGDMDPDRPEPLVFSAWIWEFARLVASDELGPLRSPAWGRKGAFVQRVLEDRTWWCDDHDTPREESCDEMLVRSLVRGVERVARRQGDDPATWRWGEEHVAVGEHLPLDKTPLARLFSPRGPVPGSMYTVNAFSFGTRDPDSTFASRHGPSLRVIYDLADLDRSLFIHSTGQSGNVLSSLYRSFEASWREGGYITIPTERESFEADALGRLLLAPR